ncbi:MAG TPA: FMN-binding protein [Micromonosporaceae bacterium]|nr:FMN-binding protein [Micromonosporaceae bacterium]
MRRTLIGVAGAVAGAAAVLAGHTLTASAVAEPTPVPSRGTGPAPSPTPRQLHDGTATGPLVQTDYGPVQVRVTVQSGVMTDITALVLPTLHEHSKWVDAELVPQLRQRVLTAQSADVDVVSGATFTGGGYLRSLQGALDQLS